MEKFKVQSISRHRMYIDGKGINTLVGLYGCPLQCKYCLNKKMLAIPKYKEMTPDELLDKVIIDYCYFKATGGGITFGGGESLLYSSQIVDFRSVLPMDIPIRVETSLNVPKESLEIVLDAADNYIIDIKTLNSKLYEKYTGAANTRVLENLQLLCERSMQDKCKIRIPNIPEFTSKTDIEETVQKITDMGFTNIDIFDYVVR